MLDQFTKGNDGFGISTIVSFAMWAILALASFLCLRSTYKAWRASGGQDRLKQEAAKEVAGQALVHNANTRSEV